MDRIFVDIPDLKSLEQISLPESPSALILSQLKILIGMSERRPIYFDYLTLEYINHFLTEKVYD